jgi:hypothetical protein
MGRPPETASSQPAATSLALVPSRPTSADSSPLDLIAALRIIAVLIIAVLIIAVLIVALPIGDCIQSINTALGSLTPFRKRAHHHEPTFHVDRSGGATQRTAEFES